MTIPLKKDLEKSVSFEKLISTTLTCESRIDPKKLFDLLFWNF